MSLARKIARRKEMEATGAVNRCPRCHCGLEYKPADTGENIKVCANCGWVQRGYYARLVENKKGE